MQPAYDKCACDLLKGACIGDQNTTQRWSSPDKHLPDNRKLVESTCRERDKLGVGRHLSVASTESLPLLPGTSTDLWCLILVMDKTVPCIFAVGMLIAVSVFAQDSGTKPDKVSQPTPAQQPHRIRVDEDVQKAKLVRVVSPVYPPFLGKRMDGTVVLHVIVGRNGSVKSARPVSGLPNLRGSAVNAVLQWQYKPTLVNGLAVEVDTSVSVVFPPIAKQ